MAGVNKVTLLGRVGKDPEIKDINSDLKVATFTLATDQSYKDKAGNKVENTQWHNIQAWRGLAGVIERYVKKGDLLYLEGSIKYSSWDKPDGTKGYKTEIVIDEMVMVGGKKDGQQGGSSSAPSSGGQPPAPEDDLPFS